MPTPFTNTAQPTFGNEQGYTFTSADGSQSITLHWHPTIPFGVVVVQTEGITDDEESQLIDAWEAAMFNLSNDGRRHLSIEEKMKVVTLHLNP